jgi:phospholipase/carboxylesterase
MIDGNDLTMLAGPRFGPTSGKDPRQLIILLHGRGANGDDLIGLAPHFAAALPDAAFIAPNAPNDCDIGFGFQWFSGGPDIDPATLLGQIRETAELVDAFIDDELAKHHLSDSQMALVGFSQGTMMSLFVAPRRANPCAGIMGYSGRLDSPDALAREIKCRPPVVLVHGDADTLLPANLMYEAAAALTANGFEVSSHIRPGLGHGIDEEGLRLGVEFLSRVLGD